MLEVPLAKLASLFYVCRGEELEHARMVDLDAQLHEDVVEFLEAHSALAVCEMLEKCFGVK